MGRGEKRRLLQYVIPDLSYDYCRREQEQEGPRQEKRMENMKSEIKYVVETKIDSRLKNVLQFDIGHPLITPHDYRHIPNAATENRSTRDARAYRQTDRQTDRQHEITLIIKALRRYCKKNQVEGQESQHENPLQSSQKQKPLTTVSAQQRKHFFF